MAFSFKRVILYFVRILKIYFGMHKLFSKPCVFSGIGELKFEGEI